MKKPILPAALVAALAALMLASCGSDDDPVDPGADPPVVTGISATNLSPGDTVTISGSNFVTPASDNRVTFTNPLGVSTPFGGTTEELRLVVDQDATSGSVTVSHPGGSDRGPTVTVTRSIGDYFVFGGLGAGNVLSLPNPTATTRYLVIPHATNASLPYTEDIGYSIDTDALIPVVASAPATPSAPQVGLHESFEAWRWEETRRLVDRVGVPPRPYVSFNEEPAVLQQNRQFYVLKTTTGSVLNPGSFQLVNTQLRYNGSKCLVYADVDTLTGGLAGGNFRTSDLALIGQFFDNTIEATNVQYFGGYSDVDGNSKVIILISPVVNRLTPPGSGGFIAGFFLSIDLYSPPTVPNGTTNQAEVFYLLASDPSGFWGNSFPRDFTRIENISTTAHEHEHMISFSHRIFSQGGTTQETWLEEGMAHMAEDLNGFHGSNMGRAEIYLDAPGDVSLEENVASLAQRGGIYLFLRLLADRYGTDILKEIVQSKCTGRNCIPAVTGVQFYDAVAEFLAALYLTDRGITSDPRFQYTSIDLSDYGILSTAQRVAGGGQSAGIVRKSSGDFYIYSGALGTESRFEFNDLIGNGRLRHVIVRVQ
jgi:hypothetical protein